MYKPVPFFGPSRKREASICAWKAIGSIAAMLLLPFPFGLLVGPKGSAVGAMIAVFIVLSLNQTNEKGILRNRPLLWDHEIDGEAS